MSSDGPLESSRGRLHLTKIVILMPYFLVKNMTSRPLKFMQENDKVDLWYDLQSTQCIPFWPDHENMTMVVRYRDSQTVSQHFHFNSNHTTVLRTEKGKALVVTVSNVGSHEPVLISFNKYHLGDAPVKIENWCEDIHLMLKQKDSNQVTLLAPRQSLLYTWDDPTLPRELLWNNYNNKASYFSAVINKDDYGCEKVTVTVLRPNVVRTQSQSSVSSKRRSSRSSFRLRTRTTISSSSDEDDDAGSNMTRISDNTDGQLLSPGKVTLRKKKTKSDTMNVYWVSYKQGNQRVLLFTQSDHIASVTRLPAERATFEMCLSLESIGVSLVNNLRREVAYLSIMSSASVWEMELNGTWKPPPSLELVAWLEDQYRHNPHSKVDLKGSLQVNLEKMYMEKPFGCKLRRTKHPGVWFQYRHSSHFTFASLKFYRIQVDNQLLDAVFPTVLYPNRERGVNMPCVAICIMLHSAPRQNKTIKHFSVIGEEFYLKLDKGFMLSLYEIIEPFLPDFNSSSIRQQLKDLSTPLTFKAIQKGNELDRSPVIEEACIAGLQVRFSFSPRGTSHGNKVVQNDVLEWFLMSLGATLTEMKNVGLSVGQYERQCISWELLVKDFYDHAKYQLIQQIYVLVLGLDILGNPYQRLRDLCQGVRDLLYHPAIGLISGPDEFAEGAAKGCSSLMGHIVGGTAESVGLIALSVGNVLAALSFDQDYRKKRQQRLQAQSSIPRTMCRASNTFVMGVVLGVSGVIVKPVSGAQQDGVEGFFKGIGRGLMGLITKPALGVIDAVAMACDGIRRAADQGHDVILRARLPRHVSAYFSLKAFDLNESKGLAILVSLGPSHYSRTETYFSHATLSDEDRPSVVIITDKHIIMLERCSMWGGWEVSWKVAVRDLAKQPQNDTETVVLHLREDELHSRLCGATRRINCSYEEIRTSIVRAIETLMTLQMENVPCPSDPTT